MAPGSAAAKASFEGPYPERGERSTSWIQGASQSCCAGDHRQPADPLLAQLPADAGHVQLLPAGEDAGALLVKSRGRLNVAVTAREP